MPSSMSSDTGQLTLTSGFDRCPSTTTSPSSKRAPTSSHRTCCRRTPAQPGCSIDRSGPDCDRDCGPRLGRGSDTPRRDHQSSALIATRSRAEHARSRQAPRPSCRLLVVSHGCGPTVARISAEDGDDTGEEPTRLGRRPRAAALDDAGQPPSPRSRPKRQKRPGASARS